MVLARDLALIWGTHEARWDKLCYGLEGLLHYGHPNMVKNPRAHTLLGIEALRRIECQNIPRASPRNLLGLLRPLQSRSIPPTSLRKLLELDRPLQSTLHEEKVYSTLGIFEFMISQPGVKADYIQSFDAVCLVTAGVALSDHRRDALLSLLSVAGDSKSPPSEDGKWPSWVVDWSEKLEQEMYRLNSEDTQFFASAYSPPFLSISETTLTLQGWIVDTVDHLGSYMPPRRACDKFNVSSENSFFFVD